MSALVVSLHDVSPLTRETTDAILAELAALGVRRTSLLVIPNHHHRGHIGADASFGPWLRGRLAEGHEAVLHGYYHKRARRRGESALTRGITRFYTADEGEFFDIDFETARAAMERGRAEMAACCGAAPRGFIAPAWLLSAEGEAAARELGFAYTVRLRSVLHLPSGAHWTSPSLCWSVRNAWRRGVSLAWNAHLSRSLRGNPLLRISLHPPDLEHPAIWAQVRTLISRALAGRSVLTYGEWVAAEAPPPP